MSSPRLWLLSGRRSYLFGRLIALNGKITRELRDYASLLTPAEFKELDEIKRKLDKLTDARKENWKPYAVAYKEAEKLRNGN